ncbi:MAG: heme-binding domain-containing protein, partial [Flavobacteriales bacterium]|nr:heme-binding domain-containing protein [Flavobacteriales bacterium]
MKRSLIMLVVILASAQFIRPDTSLPDREAANDLIAITQPNAEVSALLRAACYDCHSNETKYPWYDRITPVNWWVQHHVDEGRAEGNFSRWGELPEKKRKHFAEEAAELIEAGEMPLPSYTWMHGEARLDQAQVRTLSAFFA